jgi:hypothetical protein
MAMALSLTEKDKEKLLEVTVKGKLAKEDYLIMVPKFEELVKKHGKVRILFRMVDFHGWEAGALWEDIKFDLKHFKDIERLAMVGDKKWEKGMSIFCRPFTVAKIKYFDQTAIAEAREWLNEVS